MGGCRSKRQGLRPESHTSGGSELTNRQVDIEHAEAAQAAAFQLEQMGRDGELAEAEKALAVLEQELERLRPALLQLVAEPQQALGE